MSPKLNYAMRIFIAAFAMFEGLIMTAAAEDSISVFEDGNYIVTKEDRDFAIDFSDAARQALQAGNSDVKAQFPGLLSTEEAPNFDSYRQIMPIITVSPEQIQSSYETAKNSHDYILKGNEQFKAFREMYHNITPKSGRYPGKSEEEAFAAYLRGTILLDSQIKALEKATGRPVEGSDKRCWWPFCPR